jgi:hypothetical protein
MDVHRGPGSSLGHTLLAVSLKALTMDLPSAELVTPSAGCEPLCANQAARTTLLVIMSTLDDVDIAPVQTSDQSRGVVIPRPGGLDGAAGGHGHGGVPAGGGPAGSRSGASASGQGGTAGGSTVMALDNGKQMCVILDDDEVSSDEDEPLQKRLRQLSGAGLTVCDEAAVADKEAADKGAAEEATMKRAAEEAVAKKAVEERAAEEVVVKAAAAEATGAARGSPAPSQTPPAAGAKRSAVLSGSTPMAKCPYRGVWKPRFVQLSPPFFFPFSILLLPFCPGPLPPARPR